jgi:hypothetical protein
MDVGCRSGRVVLCRGWSRSRIKTNVIASPRLRRAGERHSGEGEADQCGDGAADGFDGGSDAAIKGGRLTRQKPMAIPEFSRCREAAWLPGKAWKGSGCRHASALALLRGDMVATIFHCCRLGDAKSFDNSACSIGLRDWAYRHEV